MNKKKIDKQKSRLNNKNKELVRMYVRKMESKNKFKAVEVEVKSDGHK